MAAIQAKTSFMTDTIVYIPTPIEEKPEKNGWYICGTPGNFLESYYFSLDHKKFQQAVYSSGLTHWLKPLQLSCLPEIMELKDRVRELKDVKNSYESEIENLQQQVEYWKAQVPLAWDAGSESCYKAVECYGGRFLQEQHASDKETYLSEINKGK